MKLSHKDIIKLLSAEIGMDEKMTEIRLLGYLSEIRQRIDAGEHYHIDGFGTFSGDYDNLKFKPSEAFASEINYNYQGQLPVDVDLATNSAKFDENDEPDETNTIKSDILIVDEDVADEDDPFGIPDALKSSLPEELRAEDTDEDDFYEDSATEEEPDSEPEPIATSKTSEENVSESEDISDPVSDAEPEPETESAADIEDSPPQTPQGTSRIKLDSSMLFPDEDKLMESLSSDEEEKSDEQMPEADSITLDPDSWLPDLPDPDAKPEDTVAAHGNAGSESETAAEKKEIADKFDSPYAPPRKDSKQEPPKKKIGPNDFLISSSETDDDLFVAPTKPKKEVEKTKPIEKISEVPKSAEPSIVDQILSKEQVEEESKDEATTVKPVIGLRTKPRKKKSPMPVIAAVLVILLLGAGGWWVYTESGWLTKRTPVVVSADPQLTPPVSTDTETSNETQFQAGVSIPLGSADDDPDPSTQTTPTPTPTQTTTPQPVRPDPVVSGTESDVFGIYGAVRERSDRTFSIIVHSLPSESEAIRVCDEIAAKGLRCLVREARGPEGRVTWRVGIGQFPSMNGAQDAIPSLPEPYRSRNFVARVN